MSSDYTVLNPGVGGDVMDETGVTYPTAPTIRKRPNVVIAGGNPGDGVQPLNTDPNGSEYAVINRPIHSPYPGTPVASLSQVSLVSSNTETTVASYTVPSDQTFYFLGFIAAGDVDAYYKIYIGGNPVFSARTSIAVPTTQISFPYAITTASGGTTITLKVLHYISGIQANFDGTITGYVL